MIFLLKPFKITNSMNHLLLIIKREYLTKVRNKSFIIMTFLSPIIFIALIATVAYLTQLNNDKTRVISVIDETNTIHHIFKNSGNTTYNILDMPLEEAIGLVKESDGYG